MATRLSVAALVIAFFAGTFARTMSVPVFRDENMYITAGVLAQTQSLYTGFPYLQTPCLPIVYAKLFSLTGTTHYLLAARLLTFIFTAAAALLIYALSRRITRESSVATVLMLLFLSNYTMMDTMVYAWNAALTVTLSLISLYILISTLSEARVRSSLVLASGLILGLAVATKLYYIAPIGPCALICLLYPRQQTLRVRLISGLVPFLAGLALGILPIAYYAWADWRTFVFDNWTFHSINTLWREDIGSLVPMSFRQAVAMLLKLALHPSYLTVVILLLFFITRTVLDKTCFPAGLRSLLTMENVLCTLLVITTTLAVMTARPMWTHYLAMPTAYLFVLVACFCRSATPGPRDRSNLTILLVVAMICCPYGAAKMARDGARVFRPSRWTGVSVKSTAHKIREHLVKAGMQDRKVATLFPLWIVEGGLNVYKQFATGVFIYRIGDYLSDAQRERYLTTSPRTVSTLFQNDPPGAILLGSQSFEANLDGPLLQYAESNHYRLVQVDDFCLYIRPQTPATQDP